MGNQIEINHSHSIIYHISSRRRRHQRSHFPGIQTFTDLSHDPRRKEKSQQKTKGRAQQIRRTAAACKDRDARKSNQQIDTHTGKCPSGAQQKCCQHHEKPLQGEVHGICAGRNDNLDKCPHGDQRRKQTAKRHILRMFPAPRNCFFSHLFSSIMHDAFFHKRFLSWHAATVPADFRCPCMFPFAQNESSSITPPGIYGSSAQAQDSPSVLQSDKRVLHPPAT